MCEEVPRKKERDLRDCAGKRKKVKRRSINRTSDTKGRLRGKRTNSGTERKKPQARGDSRGGSPLRRIPPTQGWERSTKTQPGRGREEAELWMRCAR